MAKTSARRLDGGQPLRDAMSALGIGAGRTAELTRQVDPAGHGVSWQLISFLATEKEQWARETTSPESAALIEEALGQRRSALFQYPEEA